LDWDIPIAKLSLDHLSFKIRSMAHHREVLLRSAIAANYFNVRLTEWEPMLEPWKFGAKVVQNAASLVCRPSTEIKLFSEADLNLNLTLGMVKSMKSAIDLLSLKTAQEESEAVNFHAYRVENFTEFCVQLQRKGDEPNINLGEPLNLKPGQQISFDITEADSGNQSPTLHYEVTLLPPAPAIKADVLVSKESQASVQVVDGKHTYSLVTHVELNKGVKIVKLHSPLGLFNNTISTLHLTAEASSLQTAFAFSLEPQKEMWLPCKWLNSKPFVRLHSNSETASQYAQHFGTETPAATDAALHLCHQTDPKDGDAISTTLTALSANGQTLSVVATPKSEAAEQDRLCTLWNLQSIFVFRNYLATDVTVRVAEKVSKSEMKVVCKTIVARGDIFPVFTLSDQKDIVISLKCTSVHSEWSQWVSISTKEAKAREKKNDNSPLVVKALMKVENHHFLRIHLWQTSLAGSIIVDAYVPYWLYDLTDLRLSVHSGTKFELPFHHAGHIDSKQDSEAETDSREAVMFSFDDESSSKISLRAGSGSEASLLSKSFPIDSVGSTSAVSIPTGRDPSSTCFHVGFNIAIASGNFFRTKIITFAPRYFLINNLKQDIMVNQNSGGVAHFEVAANVRTALTWQVTGSDVANTISIRRKGANFDKYMWSAPFCVDQIGRTWIAVSQTEDSSCAEPWYLRVEVRRKSPSTYITLDEVPKSALKFHLPFRIENDCVHNTIRFRQVGTKGPWCELAPYTTTLYAWNQPRGKLSLDVQFDPDSNGKFSKATRCSLEEAADVGTVTTKAGETLHLFVKSDGPVNVLTASDFPGVTETLSGSEVKSQPANPSEAKQQRLSQLKSLQRKMEAELRSKEKALGALETPTSEEKVPRPAEIPDNKQLLRIKVSGAAGFKGSDLYFKVIYNGKEVETRDKSTNWVTFDITGVSSSNLMLSQVDVSAWEKNFFKDKWLGGIKLPISMMKQPGQCKKAYTFNREGAKASVVLWWIGLGGHHVAQSAENIQKQIASNKRILQILSHRIEATANDLESYSRNGAVESSPSDQQLVAQLAHKPCYEITAQLMAVRGLENVKCVDLQKGTVVCKVHSHALDRSSVLIVKEPADEASSLPWVKSDSTRLEFIPEVVNDDVNIASKKITKLLEDKGRYKLKEEEKILYHICNSTLITGDESESCVFVTTSNLVQIDEGKFVTEIPLDKIAEVVHKKKNAFRWDIIGIVLASGTQEQVSVSTEAAARWLTTLLSSKILERNKASLSHLRQLGKPLIPDTGDENELPAVKTVLDVADTLDNWNQKVKFVTPTAILDDHTNYDSLQFSLIFLPDVDLTASSERTAKPVLLGSASIPMRQIPVTEEGSDELQAKLSAEDPDDDVHWNRRWLQVVSTALDATEAPDMAMCVVFNRKMAAHWKERFHNRLEVRLPLVGVSMVGEPMNMADQQEELLYFSVINTFVCSEASIAQKTYEVAVQNMQLDNQQKSPLFPIMFGATPVVEKQPFLQISVNLKNTGHAFTSVVEYATVLLQKMDIKVDEGLIYTILGYINQISGSSEEVSVAFHKNFPITQSASQVTKYVPPPATKNWHFKYLHLQPIAMSISFQARTGMRKKAENMSINPMTIVFNIAGATLGNIREADLKFYQLEIENKTVIPSDMNEMVGTHYYEQGLRQIFKLIGSLEFLGNPVGLVDHLTGGVKDFFYEPAKGIVKSPEAFGEGLAKGSVSLIKGAFGVFGAAGKFTGAIGKGIATISMDDDYMAEVESKRRPDNVFEGVASGVKGIGTGIFKGVTGIVTDPLKGAKKDGASGFFKGMGKGLLGVVAKPTAGVANAVADTLKGIEKTPSSMLEEQAYSYPIRHPRKIEGSLTVYDPNKVHFRQLKHVKWDLFK